VILQKIHCPFESIAFIQQEHVVHRRFNLLGQLVDLPLEKTNLHPQFLIRRHHLADTIVDSVGDLFDPSFATVDPLYRGLEDLKETLLLRDQRTNLRFQSGQHLVQVGSCGRCFGHVFSNVLKTRGRCGRCFHHVFINFFETRRGRGGGGESGVHTYSLARRQKKPI
jgi:hypothetical protein